LSSQLIFLDKKQVSSFRRLIVVGDLHGDKIALDLLLKVIDPNRDGLIFLGDYADRGYFGLEVIETIDGFSRKFPKNIFLLKGNHEDYNRKGEPNFWPCRLYEEVERKRGNWQNFFKKEFKEFIEHLYLAVIIKNRFLFVHGGISDKIDNADKLINPSRAIELDILWSDPFNGVGERVNLKRGGVGVEFGMNITKKVCEKLGVLKIIRSHEPRKARNGPFFEHENRIVTVNSTSLYGGIPFVLNLNPYKSDEFKVILLKRNS